MAQRRGPGVNNTPERKNSIDDSHLGTSSFLTPRSSSNPRESNSDTAVSDSIVRDSIGSVLRQSLAKNRESARYSTSQRKSLIVKTPSGATTQLTSLTITELSHLEADKMLSGNFDDTVSAWDYLQCFLSTGRDSVAFKKIESKVRSEKVRLTRELRWLDALILIIKKVLAENRFKQEHEKIKTDSQPKIAREYRWAKIIEGVIKNVMPNLHQDQVQAIVTEEICLQSVAFKEEAKNHYSMKELAVFDEAMRAYFGFRSAEVNLVASFTGKATEEELKLLATQIAPSQSSVDSFYSVEAHQYVAQGLNEMYEYCKADLGYSATAKDISPEKIALQAEDIRQHLESQARDMDLIKELGRSPEELQELLDDVMLTQELVKEESTCVQEQVAYYEAFAQQTRNKLTKHFAVRKYHADLSPKALGERKYADQLGERVNSLIDQRVDVLFAMGGNNLLDKAIASRNLNFIAKVLAYAEHQGVLINVLHATLLKLKKEALKFLIAGAYLFDPERGGLYNPALVKSVCQHVEEKPHSPTSDEGDFVDRSIASNGAPASPPIKASFSIFFDEANLNPDEQKEINKLVLQGADDNNFVRFIERVEHGEWSTPVTCTESEIRAELKRRYIHGNGSSKMPVPDIVRTVLNRNLAIAERGERLATFYDKETRHVCASYARDHDLYAGKASYILSKFKTAAQSLDQLEKEAACIANDAINLNSDLGKRRRGCVSDPHAISTTQRLFADARKMLPSEGFVASARRGWVRFANALPGSERQNDVSVLAGPIATVDAGLTGALLEKIPFTSQQKDDCVKRAALARGVFKTTLEYLEGRKYGKDKKEIMDSYIQKYINGRDEKGEKYTAKRLVEDLDQQKINSDTLGKRVWGFWAPKTADKLNADLMNRDAFQALDQKIVAAAG